MAGREQWRSVNTTIGGEDKELTPDNCEIFRFRQEPEYDYFHLFEPTNPDVDDDLYSHTVVFRVKKLLVWMGGACIRGDYPFSKSARAEMGGDFTDVSGGWRPNVHIEDIATEAEKEWFIQSQLSDLNETEGVPDEFQE